MVIINASKWRFLCVFAIFLILSAIAIQVHATSLAEEIDLGKKIDIEIMKQTPLSDNKEGAKEIEEYGQLLVKGVQRPQIPYHFKILKDEDFNAFSIPGGYVYFTDHLWNVLRKDERIGVLAHEITHVDRRHAIDAMSKQQRRQIWMSAIFTVLKAGQTVGDIANMAESLYTLKYSRSDEQQADEIGAALCQKANFNPAGILLAMRKINRFESENGGSPPKIFASHPPSKERIQYLTQLLTKMNVPVPPENITEESNPYKIGEVASADQNTAVITTSISLKKGDTVWMMRNGWDYYYEKHIAVPIARGVVTNTNGTITAKIWQMSSEKKDKVIKGTIVSNPPSPKPESGTSYIEPSGNDSGNNIGWLRPNVGLKSMDRLLAKQVVWNKDNTKLINDNTGYIIVTNPSNKTGYIALTRPKYSYAPINSDAALIKFTDPDSSRWIGPVISIGKSGQMIEVTIQKPLDEKKTYEVAYPAWNPDDTYGNRVIGTAKLQSSDNKIVLQMMNYKNGWSITDIQNGFDVYEKQETTEAK